MSLVVMVFRGGKLVGDNFYAAFPFCNLGIRGAISFSNGYGRLLSVICLNPEMDTDGA